MINKITIEIFRRFRKRLNMMMIEFLHHPEASNSHRFKEIKMSNLNQNVIIELQK